MAPPLEGHQLNPEVTTEVLLCAFITGKQVSVKATNIPTKD